MTRVHDWGPRNKNARRAEVKVAATDATEACVWAHHLGLRLVVGEFLRNTLQTIVSLDVEVKQKQFMKPKARRRL